MMNRKKSLYVLLIVLFFISVTYLSYAQISLGCPWAGFLRCLKADAGDVGVTIGDRCAPDCSDCTDCHCVPKPNPPGGEDCDCRHSENRTRSWRCKEWRRNCYRGTTQVSFGELDAICSTVEGGGPAPVCGTGACCCGCCILSITLFGKTYCFGWVSVGLDHGPGANFPMAEEYTISQLPYNDTGNCQAADGSRCRICEEVFCDVPVWNWGPKECIYWDCPDPCSGCP